MQVLELVRAAGVLRPRDLDAEGIPRVYLRRMYQRGLLDQPARGLYVLPDAPFTENRGLAEASKRYPGAVVCLLSALRFHELTTQNPFEVWLALEGKAWRPRPSDLPLRFFRLSGAAFTEGIERHRLEGVPVKVYSVAKTVADCFKFRGRIGMDVAMEALREGWHERRFTMDELWHYATVCRVAPLMRPYMESLV
jgi:predicted transcriptional regulator of viral defense system